MTVHKDDIPVQLAGDSAYSLEGEFDALLSGLLQEVGRAPSGLSDRVFQASVGFLPAVDHQFAPRTLPFSDAVRTSFSVGGWRRIALAASVAVAGAVGLKVCLPSTSAGAGAAVAAVSDADWSAFGGPQAGNGSVTHLLRASDVSYTDLVSELSTLASAGDAEM